VASVGALDLMDGPALKGSMVKHHDGPAGAALRQLLA
jgi:hypothetical protein